MKIIFKCVNASSIFDFLKVRLKVRLNVGKYMTVAENKMSVKKHLE